MVFTDNVLALLAMACTQESGSGNHDTVLNSMHDINNFAFTVRAYVGNSTTVMSSSVVLFQAQIGKGTSPATRQDFNIENPFTNGGEEDNRKLSIKAVYVNATEKIEMSTQFSALGLGAISEVCKFIVINDISSADRTILISRDIIDPPVNFIASDIINVLNEVLT